MKKFIYLLLFWNATQAQSIVNGIYLNEGNKSYFQREFFNFEQDNNFKFLSFGWEGNAFGTGKYYIENDSVYLKFEKCEKYNKYRNLEKVKGKSDSLKINIITKLETEEISSRCEILENGQYLESEDKLDVTIPKNHTIFTLRFPFIGCEPIDVIANNDISEVKGEIIFDDYFIYEKDIKSFEIKKLASKKIVWSSLKEKSVLKKIDSKTALEKLIKYNANSDYEFYIYAFLEKTVANRW